MTAPTPETAAVRVLLRGTEALRARLLSAAHGGAQTWGGLVELVARQHPAAPSIEPFFEPCEGMRVFEEALASPVSGSGPGGTALRDLSPHVVVLSLDADLAASDRTWGSQKADEFEESMRTVIQSIKKSTGSHVIVLNASSLDPKDHVSDYHGLDREPLSLAAHRFNLAVMHLSSQEGISIVDVDRLVAEIGGSRSVQGFQNFSAEACEAIVAELVRVVADYGFFDDRPVLPQVGRQAS